MERAVTFPGYEDVEAGIVRWPMSVLRLRCGDDERLVELADKILTAWRGYSDPAVSIYAETDGEPHNTITPIARRREGKFELDLVLRNNLTTPEHPMGLFHPHAELHHIKKENIGLIEVMGLAVLPARLQGGAGAAWESCWSPAGNVAADPELAKHAPWAEELRGEVHLHRGERGPDPPGRGGQGLRPGPGARRGSTSGTRPARPPSCGFVE